MKTLSPVQRIVIQPHTSGSVLSKEVISAPECGYGIASIRKRFGRMGLTVASQLVESGHTGQFEIQLYNNSPDIIEIYAGEPLVNYIVVPKFNESI